MLANITQALGEIAHTLTALPFERQLFQRIQAQRIGGRQAHLGLARLLLVEIPKGRQHRLQSAVGQGHLQRALLARLLAVQWHQNLLVVAAARQLRRVEQLWVSAQQIEQNRQQTQALAIDHNAQFQVEPVALRPFVDGRVPVIHRRQVKGELFAIFDLPALLAQLGQVVDDET